MIENNVLNDYFEWLCCTVKKEQPSKRASYKKLLVLLHSITFRYSVEYDENRAADGEHLRWRYVYDGGYQDILNWEEPCTVLEMIIALSFQMEGIMSDPDVDHGVSHWFWIMISNLNLDYMSNSKFDRLIVYERINVFLDRMYEPNGKGNIFRIDICREDLREVEIWYQMCWYLDSIL